MSLEGKKISELARVTSVRDDSLLVVDNGGTESNSVYVSDLLKNVGSDKQDKLTAGDNITINNNVISADVISDRNIGEIVASVLPLTDAGLHLLDGSLIPGDGIYGEFVNYVAGLYNDNPNANYFTTEENWQSSYSTYGSCGKFVYDSVANTVRLPRIEGFIEGTSNLSKLGELVKAGLPNITGRAGDNIQDSAATTLNNATVEGAFYYGSSKNSDNLKFSSVGVSLCNALCLDASRSNSIYGNSTTVQPQAVKVFYYIIVASSSKNTIGNDGTKIVEDLQYKANNDLSNVVKPNQAFINQSVGWMIPDYKRGISIPRETLQNWVAPATGVLYGRVDWNSTGGWIYVNGYPTVGGVSDTSSIGGIVLNTGDVVTYSNFDTNATSYFYFYPFQGAI